MDKTRLIRSILSVTLALLMIIAPVFSSASAAIALSVEDNVVATESENSDKAESESAADKSDNDTATESDSDKSSVDKSSQESGSKDTAKAESESSEGGQSNKKSASDDTAKAKKTKYEFIDEEEGLKVSAKLSDASAIPDDAELIATPVTPDSKDYNYKAYMAALNKDADASYDESNTLLYDIAFIKDDTEIEPATGTVSVTFEFLDSQLADEIGAEKASDITVIHLPLTDKVKDKYDTTADARKIDADDINVEAVTKEDNDLSVNLKKEKVEFEVESFSLFAVTLPSQKDKSFQVKFVDSDNNDITDDTSLQKTFILATLNHNEDSKKYYTLTKLNSFSETVTIADNVWGFRFENSTPQGHFSGDVVDVDVVQADYDFNPSDAYYNESFINSLNPVSSIGKYTLGNVTNEDNVYSVTLDEAKPAIVNVNFNDSKGNAASPALSEFNYYYVLVYLHHPNDTREDNYFVMPIDLTEPSKTYSIPSFRDGNNSGEYYYNETTDSVEAFIVGSDKSNPSIWDLRSIIGGNNGENWSKSRSGDYLKEYTIESIGNDPNTKPGTNEVTLNLTERPQYKVEVNFFDYDGATSYEADATGNYYIRVKATGKSGTDYDGKEFYAVKPISIAGETTARTSILGFIETSTEFSGATADTYAYDPDKIEITDVRLINDSSGALWNYETANNANDTVSGFEFVRSGIANNIHLKRSYDKKYDVRLYFDPEGDDISSSDDYYVFITVGHETGEDTYFLKKLDISKADIQKNAYGYYYDINVPNWQNGSLQELDGKDGRRLDKFTGNEKSITVRLLKALNGNTFNSVGDAQDGSKATILSEGALVKAYTVEYGTRATEKNDSEHTNYTIDQIYLTKSEATKDYTFKSILGPALNYGITAEHFEQCMHMQTNLATNKYTNPGGANATEPDLSGSSSGAFAISEFDGDSQLFLGTSHKGQVLFYADSAKENPLKDPRDFVTIVKEPGKDIKKNIVDPVIDYMENMSQELLGHEATYHPTLPEQTNNKLQIDTTAYAEDATIYLEADELVPWISSGGQMQITKHPNQVIVFNLRNTTSITLDEFDVKYPGDESYTKTDTPTTQGDKNTWLSSLSQHIVWNLASATNIQLTKTTGIFLIPQETSTTDITGTASGWIVSDGYVKNSGGEWHSVYADLADVDVATLYAYKQIKDKESDTATHNATSQQKFNFKFEHFVDNKWEELSGQTDKGVVQNEGSSASCEVKQLTEGWNVYRITETSVAEGTAGQYAENTQVYYAAVKYTITKQQQKEGDVEKEVTIKVAGLPQYYSSFDPATFDPTSETLAGLSGDVSKAVFTNTLETGDLELEKQVTGTTDTSKRFTFTIEIQVPAPTEDNANATVALSGLYDCTMGGDTSKLEFKNGRANVVLTAGQKATISGLPAGSTYTVKESKIDDKLMSDDGTAVDGYSLDRKTNDTGSITKDQKAEVKFINAYADDEKGSLKITKNVTVNGAEPTNDNKSEASGTFNFTVTGPGTSGTTQNVSIEIKNGVAQTKTITGLEPGEYTVTEDTNNMPEGFNLAAGVVNPQTITVTVGDTADIPTATFTNNKTVEAATGSLKVTKVATVTPAGETVTYPTFKFTVKNNSNQYINADGTTSEEPVEHEITANDTNGVIFNNLPIGVYTVTEVGTGDSGAAQIAGYTLTASGSVSIPVSKNSTATAELTNSYEKKTGEARVDHSVTITKKDQAGAQLSGAKFGLYSDQECSTDVEEYTGGSFQIDTSDTALSSYLPTTNGGSTTLYLKETEAPAGYQVDSTAYPVVISTTIAEAYDATQDKFITTTTYDIKISGESSKDITNNKITRNDVVHNGITINKQDEAKHALEGATFKLYDGETVVASYTSNTNGVININTGDEALANYLPAAENTKNLTLKEDTAPAGYEKDNTSYPVVISASSVEELKEGVFVTTTTYSITIDGKANADITNEKNTDTGREDSQITINKKDADNNTLNGATFILSDGDTVIKTFTGGSFTVKTDDAELADYLPAVGATKNLTLKETAAPSGYEKIDTAYSVTITATSKEELKDGTYVTTTTYSIKINDNDSTDITNTKKTGEDRKDGSITITKKDTTGETLNGAEFGLYTDEACTNKVTNYSGSNFTISTSDDALKTRLPADNGGTTTLYLKETKAPAGYSASTTVHTVVISKTVTEAYNQSQDKYITTTEYGIKIDGNTNADITNEKKTGEAKVDDSVTITKKGENGETLNNAEFKLYADEACNTEVNSYTGGSFTIGTADEALKNYLPSENNDSKTLYLKETKAPAGYSAAETAYPVVIGASVATALDKEKDMFITKTTYTMTIDNGSSAEITNTKKTDTDREDASITITKKDDDKKTLSGAKFELTTGTIFKKTIEVGSGGSFVISTADEELAPYLPKKNGDTVEFALKEVEAPSGYEMDKTSHPVVITTSINEEYDSTKDAYVTKTKYSITIDGKSSADITNKKKTDTDRVDNKITINKQDAAGKALTGATFKLYDETTEIASYNGGTFEISTADKNLAECLPAVGSEKTLTLKETAAPTGYDKDNTDYSVVIGASSAEELKNGVFVTTTTYTIKIDGKTSADIKNALRVATGDITLTGTKVMKNADITKYNFTFSIYDADEYKTYVDGGKKGEKPTAVSTASTKDAQPDDKGVVTLNFGKIEYSLSDLETKDDEGRVTKLDESREYKYVAVEDIPDTVDKNGYDKTADIQYDTTEYPITVTVKDVGTNALDVSSDTQSLALKFTNAKKYTKLKLTKTIKELIKGDHENTTLVFRVTGEGFEEYLNVHFDAEEGNVKTEEIPVPFGIKLTVEEVYSGNYKPADPVTITPKDLVTKDDEGNELDEPYYKVSFVNELVGSTHTQGIINKYKQDADGSFTIKDRVGSEEEN